MSNNLEAEIENSANRVAIFFDKDRFNVPVDLSDQTVDDLREIALYIEGLADRTDEFLHPHVDPPPPPPTWDAGPLGQLDTQLDGKRLPKRGAYELNAARQYLYGASVTDAHRSGLRISGVKSAGVKMQGNASIEDFVVFNSDGDAIKGISGGITCKRGHTLGLGLKAGAHADGFQTQGNLANFYFEDWFFDQPTNEGNGTRSNACIILNSKDGPNGDGDVHRCILRGGNRSIMIDGRNGHRLAQVNITETAFIVEKDSPRYTLWTPGIEDRLFFDDKCGVYQLDHKGVCHLITRDIKAYNHYAWHEAQFNRRPV